MKKEKAFKLIPIIGVFDTFYMLGKDITKSHLLLLQQICYISQEQHFNVHHKIHQRFSKI